jgi:hypothetical protein
MRTTYADSELLRAFGKALLEYLSSIFQDFMW